MVMIKEYRVTMPMTVEEYQVAQLYSVAEASKNETGGGEGIEVKTNEPFAPGTPHQPDEPLLDSSRFHSGQYTHKIYHLQSKVPAIIRALAPKGSLEIHEEAWNAYPYCRTIITNPAYMKKGFYIKIESLHLPDRGDTQNAHQLPPEKMPTRENVVPIDIAHDPVNSNDVKPDEDPAKYISKKTGRGPLASLNWKNEVDPVMTCYKLVSCEFVWWGLQTKVEKIIHKTERRIFTNFHRQVFCWTDKWYGLTMDDIRAIEDRTKEELDAQRKQGPVRGTKSDD